MKKEYIVGGFAGDPCLLIEKRNEKSKLEHEKNTWQRQTQPDK